MCDPRIHEKYFLRAREQKNARFKITAVETGRQEMGWKRDPGRCAVWVIALGWLVVSQVLTILLKVNNETKEGHA